MSLTTGEILVIGSLMVENDWSERIRGPGLKFFGFILFSSFER